MASKEEKAKAAAEKAKAAAKAKAKQPQEDAAALEARGPRPSNRMVQGGQVTVRVVRQSIAEDGHQYHKGDTLDLHPTRAAALGGLVERVEPEPVDPVQADDEETKDGE